MQTSASSKRMIVLQVNSWIWASFLLGRAASCVGLWRLRTGWGLRSMRASLPSSVQRRSCCWRRVQSKWAVHRWQPGWIDSWSTSRGWGSSACLDWPPAWSLLPTAPSCRSKCCSTPRSSSQLTARPPLLRTISGPPSWKTCPNPKSTWTRHYYRPPSN